MSNKVLFILTSADKMSSGQPTGWYLPEMAHPYKVLVDGGVTDIDVISPKGGKAPVDPSSVEAFKEEPMCQWFLANEKAQSLINNTTTPDGGKEKVSGLKYGAVIIPGGHGTMFDLATDEKMAKIIRDCWEHGGIVAAVCHGPAALVPVLLSNGEPLVKGKKVASFTNEEEDAVGMTSAMPFSLESKLVEMGADFSKADNWKEHVVVAGKLVTGQNPQSSLKLGQKVLELFLKLQKEVK